MLSLSSDDQGVIYKDNQSGVRLRIWLHGTDQGHDTVIITSTKYLASPCNYTVRYIVQDPPRTEILYQGDSPSDPVDGKCFEE